MVNKAYYIELGLICADACRTVHQGVKKTQLDEHTQSLREATNTQLPM